VVYGATRAEREQAAIMGLMMGGVLAAIVLWQLPGWLNSYFSWQVPVGFGLGIFALLVGGVLTLAVTYRYTQLEELRHRKLPPRFFRSTVA
jgi:MFS family permease